MRTKLVNGGVVLAAAILAVVFLLRPWEKEVSSDQFVVHRREKRDLDASGPVPVQSSSTECTNSTGCVHGGVNTTHLNYEEGSRLCQLNTTHHFKVNCSGELFNFTDYCAKLKENSNNGTAFKTNCSKVLGVAPYGSVNITNTSTMVVQLLVSPSKVLNVSLGSSVKPGEAASSVLIQLLPNKTVSILAQGTPVANTSGSVVDHVKPSSTVHIGVPVSSSVELKLVPTTEKVSPSTVAVLNTTSEQPTVIGQSPTRTETPTTEKTSDVDHESHTTKEPFTIEAPSEPKKGTTVQTTIHIIKNTMKSPYEEEEQSVRFFMSNVMMPISCGVGAAIIIALAFFMYRRCKRRQLKRVRYFGNRPGEKQFLDRMKLLEDSSEEE